MDRLVQDLRIAIRGLRRSPTFAVATVLIIGLAIGMAVAMYTTFQAILVHRLPVQDQERLVVLWTYQVPGIEYSLPASDLQTIAHASRTMRDIAGVAHYGAYDVALIDDDHPFTLRAGVVTANYFDVLGARPILGRFFRAEDAMPGAPTVVVLSYGEWQSRYGASRSVIGRQLLDPQTGDHFPIIGVGPPGLDYPVGVQGWFTARRDAGLQTLAVARLANAATIDGAREEFFSLGSRLQPTFRLTGAKAESLATGVVGNVRPALLALLAAVALLLIIACVNVGTLFFVRMSSRNGEMAVRRALGARQSDLVRQLLVESMVVALTGGALGLMCARALLGGLLAVAPPQLPRLDDIGRYGNLLGAALCLTVGTVLLFGLVPAVAATHADLATPLRPGPRSGTGTQKRRVAREWLVAAQVALALVMLSGAGLLGRSLLALEHLSLGYRANHLSIGSVAFNGTRYDSVEKITNLTELVMRRFESIPGVTAATPTLIPPFFGPNVWRVTFEAEDQISADSGDKPSIPVEAAGLDYFRTFGVPIVRGRAFAQTDQREAPLVVIVSQSVARKFWPGAEAIGKRLRIARSMCGRDCDAPSSDFQWRTVVGVVPDTRFRSLREAWPMVYFPLKQALWPGWQGYFAVRSTPTAAALTPAFRAALRDIDPTLALFDFRSMDDALGRPLAEPRLTALLVTAFGAAALLLASVGLYGVIASTVRERTHEIGVRMALGASSARIRDAVLRQMLLVTGAGAAAGVVVSVLSTRLLRSLLYGVSPTDPITLASVCIVLLVAAGIATYLPALRATRIDPVLALRTE